MEGKENDETRKASSDQVDQLITPSDHVSDRIYPSFELEERVWRYDGHLFVPCPCLRLAHPKIRHRRQ